MAKHAEARGQVSPLLPHVSSRDEIRLSDFVANLSAEPSCWSRLHIFNQCAWPPIILGSTWMNSANNRSKKLGKRFVSVLNTHRLLFLGDIPWGPQSNSHLYDVCIVSGILSHLEMIHSVWQDVSGVYANRVSSQVSWHPPDTKRYGCASPAPTTAAG